MEIPSNPKRHVQLTKRLKTSFRWYAEHPEDLETVSGSRFKEILRSEYPDYWRELVAITGGKIV